MSSRIGVRMSSPVWGAGVLVVWMALWCWFALALIRPAALARGGEQRGAVVEGA